MDYESYLELVKKRRSIRNFDKRTPDISLIKKCIEAACNAPSAHNSQPWKFIIVKDREKINQLGETQKHSQFLKNAPMAIVVLAEEEKSPNHFVEDCSCAIMLLMLQRSFLHTSISSLLEYVHQSWATELIKKSKYMFLVNRKRDFL